MRINRRFHSLYRRSSEKSWEISGKIFVSFLRHRQTRAPFRTFFRRTRRKLTNLKKLRRLTKGQSNSDVRQQSMNALFLNTLELELLSRFNSAGVRYLVIGGHAVQFHGYLRSTKDLDIFIDTSGDNPSQVVTALHSLGF